MLGQVFTVHVNVQENVPTEVQVFHASRSICCRLKALRSQTTTSAPRSWCRVSSSKRPKRRRVPSGTQAMGKLQKKALCWLCSLSVQPSSVRLQSYDRSRQSKTWRISWKCVPCLALYSCLVGSPYLVVVLELHRLFLRHLVSI